MTGTGEVPPWMTEAERRLADFANDHAAIAAAVWGQFQTANPGFEGLRGLLVERYQRLFTPPGAPTAGAAFAQLATAIAIDACQRLSAELAKTGPDASPITSLRELHALFIDCGEAAYAVAAHREEFAAAQAELLAAIVELRAGQGPA